MSCNAHFTPAPFFSNPHVQTLWPTLFRSTVKLALKRERITLADGDFIDLDWGASQTGPIVLLCHGLEGSVNSPYIRGMMASLSASGWRVVVMNFRGCSGEPNRLARAYHSGDTGDIAHIITHLQRQYPRDNLFAIGYSLGGNALLKYLGEIGNSQTLTAAVAVSVPFDLDNAAYTLRKSAFGLYQRYLLGKLKASVLRKRPLLDDCIDINAAISAKHFHEFDNLVTAPLHGFKNVEEYYAQSSCAQYLSSIRTPTRIIHAIDDPFLDKSAIPGKNMLSSSVNLEPSSHGGHVGFINREGYWLESAIPAYLARFR